MFCTFSCQMASVHLVRCSTSPQPSRPWSAVRLSSEYCLDCPPIDYWPHVGVKDVQDRGGHGIVDALQTEQPLAGGGDSDGAPGGLAPIVPKRVGQSDSPPTFQCWMQSMDALVRLSMSCSVLTVREPKPCPVFHAAIRRSSRGLR